MPDLALDDVELYYEVHGTGPRVLFFNGSGSTIESVQLLIQMLASRCTVAVHDQRGLGRTSVPQPPYTMADYAADGAALMDHLGWDTVSILGLSFGGMVAQEFAVTWPDRVDRLALLCTSPGGPDTSSYPLHELRDLPSAERASEGLRLLDLRFADPRWFDEHPSDLALVTQLADRQGDESTEQQTVGIEGQLRARATHDVRDRLAKITCPTLVAAGRYDGIAPPANSRAIVSAVPTSTLVEFEGGHAFIAQDPTALAKILGFLAD